ncbi:MAG: hypothetical protein HUU37_05100 [Bdellovibrionales bacterium]|nr:hypothetical protein [Bdellovibrionales bacterium]
MKILALLLLIPSLSHGAACQTITRRPGVELQKCDRLHVLYLEGTPRERARLHGELLGRELSIDVMDYFSNKIFDPIRGAPGWAKWIVEKAYNVWARILFRGAPANFHEEVSALAHGAGLDPIHFKRAVALPDTSHFLSRIAGISWLRWLPSAGCTSVAVRSRGGDFIYGRNLDFAGALLWDRHPLVTVHLPPAGSGELRHASFGADGAHFSGITGMNEEGIVFAVHQNYSRDMRVGGVPMFFVGELVLRQARNLEDAVEILRKNRPSPLWTFVVIDTKSGQALAAESSRKHFEVRRMEGDVFVQTNHLQSAPLLPWERISFGTKWNSVYRFETATQMARRGGASLQSVARILSHQSSPGGEISSYYDVLKAHTIQTVFVEKKNGRLRAVVSADDAPTSGGDFVALDVASLWNRAPLAFERLRPAGVTPTARKNQRAISRAFSRYFDHRDYGGAIAQLASHRTLDASLFRATAELQAGNPEAALEEASLALENPRFRSGPAHVVQSLERVRLLALWKAGKHQEARELAQKIVDRGFSRPSLLETAKAIRENREAPLSVRKPVFEFFSGDLGGLEGP